MLKLRRVMDGFGLLRLSKSEALKLIEELEEARDKALDVAFSALETDSQVIAGKAARLASDMNAELDRLHKRYQIGRKDSDGVRQPFDD